MSPKRPRIGPPAAIGTALVLIAIIPSLLPEAPFEVRAGVALVCGLAAIVLFIVAARAHWWNEGYEAAINENHTSQPDSSSSPAEVTEKAARPKLRYAGHENYSALSGGAYGYRRWSAETDSAAMVQRGILVAFRQTKGSDCWARARLIFTDVKGAAIKVHSGCWLNQPINVAGFTLSDTRELVIAVTERIRTTAFTLEDERENAGQAGVTERGLAAGSYAVKLQLDVLFNNETEMVTDEYEFRMFIDALNPHSAKIEKD